MVSCVDNLKIGSFNYGHPVYCIDNRNFVKHRTILVILLSKGCLYKGLFEKKVTEIIVVDEDENSKNFHYHFA